MIEYPDAQCFVYFSQVENPLITPHNSDVTMDLYNHTCKNATAKFSGLTKYEGQYDTCFLDGYNFAEKPNNYYYAIGQRTGWNGQIAGFTMEASPKLMEVNLWVEINDFSILDKFKSYYSCKVSQRTAIQYLFMLCAISLK